MEGGKPLGDPPLVDRGLALVHRMSGIERASRMIGLGQRRAENRHHRIADELHHGPVLGDDRPVHLRPVLVQLVGEDGGIGIFGDRRVATDVGHQHGHHERFRFPDPAPFTPEFVRDARG